MATSVRVDRNARFTPRLANGLRQVFDGDWPPCFDPESPIWVAIFAVFVFALLGAMLVSNGNTAKTPD